MFPTPYQSGYRAFIAGVPRDRAPAFPTFADALEWRSGWHAAKHDYHTAA